MSIWLNYSEDEKWFCYNKQQWPEKFQQNRQLKRIGG